MQWPGVAPGLGYTERGTATPADPGKREGKGSKKRPFDRSEAQTNLLIKGAACARQQVLGKIKGIGGHTHNLTFKSESLYAVSAWQSTFGMPKVIL